MVAQRNITDMCEKTLEIIKTRSLFLREGCLSDEIVLQDEEGEGNMYFKFLLKYICNDVNGNGNTHIDIKDDFHADIVIETRPNAVTKLEKPYKIGTYANRNDLLFNFVVQPCGMDGTHNVTITFYIS